LYLLVSSALAVFVLSFTVTAMGRDMSFLWDRNLGGRIAQLDVLSDMRIIPYKMFTSLTEIAYLGVIEFFGIPGFFLFVAYLAVVPVILWLEGVPPLSLSPASACQQGLLIYMVLACSDAAFGFIPVMMVFWMIAGLGLWYAHHQARLEGLVRATSN